ncbi:hypothetical protein [Alicyclobacillus fastidiosus]|uniref:Uncharacterized protein n=1 Tax=Alicyclobacillus fastidiosus TaxID=392011 RepID=A0ABV5AI10_9BACL
MNSEDRLNLLWARKTAIQLLQQQGQHKRSFVCPICSGMAHVYLINGRYRSYCENQCFTSVDDVSASE